MFILTLVEIAKDALSTVPYCYMEKNCQLGLYCDILIVLPDYRSRSCKKGVLGAYLDGISMSKYPKKNIDNAQL